MIKRKWVVLFQHPYYPEIHLFDDKREAFLKEAELIEEHLLDEGPHNGFIFVGALEGVYTEVKPYY